MTGKILSPVEFGALSPEHQLDVLRKDGVYIGKRKTGKKMVILYQLHSFYVELFYSKYRKEMESLSITGDLEILQPYLSQIKIRELDEGENL